MSYLLAKIIANNIDNCVQLVKLNNEIIVPDEFVDVVYSLSLLNMNFIDVVYIMSFISTIFTIVIDKTVNSGIIVCVITGCSVVVFITNSCTRPTKLEHEIDFEKFRYQYAVAIV